MPARRLVPRMVTTNAGWLSRCSEIRTSSSASGLGRAHQVVAVDRVERRHVQPFACHRGPVAVGWQQIGVPSAVRVVHFGDDVAQHAVGVVTPVQGQRVEHVAQHPGLHQRGDPATGQVDAVVGEKRIDALSQ